MTVQEIFNTKAVQEIETEILNLQYETEKRRLFRDSEGLAIKSLLGIRRNIGSPVKPCVYPKIIDSL